MHKGQGLVTVDGSYLEGGGQIVRTAVGLSAATGLPCLITNIRKGRPKPGLAAQHLAGIKAVALTCDAELKGAEIGSREVLFRPRHLRPPPHLLSQVGTAGAVTLVLQAIMIPIARSGEDVVVEVCGGTHVRWAPTVDYVRHTLLYFLGRMGVSASVDVLRYGFYPKGGGKVEVRIHGGPLRGVDFIERGGALRIEAWSVASEELRRSRVAERQIDGARRFVSIDVAHIDYVPSLSVGSAVCLQASYENCRISASALGKKGRPAEKVGAECASLLGGQVASGACLDMHMADQILPFMALAEVDSRVSVSQITDHCRTSIWVIEKLLPVKFEVDETRRLISCSH